MSLELVCPAGNLPALKIAVDSGADCVYFGFRNNTNARAFAGLNFDADTARHGIRYAREHGCKALLALNTFPQTAQWDVWRQAVDDAATQTPAGTNRQQNSFRLSNACAGPIARYSTAMPRGRQHISMLSP
jgi:collagenase-like PrtC family protease